MPGPTKKSPSTKKSQSNASGTKPQANLESPSSSVILPLTPKKKPAKKKSKTSPKEKLQEKKQQLKKEPVVRDILYSKLEVQLCSAKQSLSGSAAQKLLGWREESENLKFKGDYLLVYESDDAKGKPVKHKVRCTNNVKNRPLYRTIYETLTQEILRNRWRLNGEPIIIGKTGLILNGQHTLIALALAVQRWNKRPAMYPQWSTEPKIDKIVVYGIEETDEVVNTMDTCKPRSLTDVIYRSEYFVAMKAKDRKQCSRITDHAIRLLWSRTGAADDAFAPRRTHAEALDFLNRHTRVLEAVQHIHLEDGTEANISRYLTPGYAAGMLYLMAAAVTDRSGYAEHSFPNEEQVDFLLWEQAEKFWVLLASRAQELDPLRGAFEKFEDAPSLDERLALFVKAWNRWSNDEKITAKSLELEYEKSENGWRVLAETPICGGIDIA